MGLKTGETLTVEELLDGMLLPSGDDAASAIAADTVDATLRGGDERAGRRAWAAQTRCSQRRLDRRSPSLRLRLRPGGHRGVHRRTSSRSSIKSSTAGAWCCLQTPASASTCATSTVCCRLSCAVGIKPGWTGNAGACLIGMAVRDGHRLLAVLLNANLRGATREPPVRLGIRARRTPALLPPRQANGLTPTARGDGVASGLVGAPRA